MKVKSILAVIAVGGLLISLPIPSKSLDAPTWDVWIVDQAGNPVTGINVRESYRNYSAENDGHEETQVTDLSGHVHFEAKTLRSSLLMRVLVTLASTTAGVHASFGPNAWVFAFGNGLEGNDVRNGYVYDWTGSPAKVTSRIVAK